MLNRYHPANAELVLKHSEFGRPKCVLKMHCNLAAVSERVFSGVCMNPVHVRKRGDRLKPATAAQFF